MVRILELVRDELTQHKRFDSYADPDMSGACAIASYVGYVALRAMGYEPEFVSAWRIDFDSGHLSSHCWLELDGLRYDATATQYGTKDWVFVTDASIRHQYYDRYDKRLYGSAALYEVMDPSVWGEQSPQRYGSWVKSTVRKLQDRVQDACA